MAEVQAFAATFLTDSSWPIAPVRDGNSRPVPVVR
jgi:hypothetical protein